MDPDRLGAALFSVGDLYAKLKGFSSRLHTSTKPFFFAKVDVQAAFDTIPQSAVIKLMSTLPRESAYRICKHAEIKPGDNNNLGEVGQAKSKPIRKWISLAGSTSSLEPFQWTLEKSLAVGKKNTVFAENIVTQFRDTDELLALLAEHVQRNMVKVGKKFYRQKNGIPQGSVLSSLLCNYFYADLEAHHLAFLKSGDSILLRMIDDFLLITTDAQHAKKFLEVMHNGLPDYGVSVNPAKTLANFEASVNGQKVARLVDGRRFPYCGSFIHTKTLNVTKDRERRKNMGECSL
jgi:telomerase reverse transcriptase